MAVKELEQQQDLQDLIAAFGEMLAAERRANRKVLEALRQDLAAELKAIRTEMDELRRGRSFEICGTYDPGESYFRLDVVALDGASFIARHDNPGRCPGAGWQLLCKQGRAGRPGPPGERGSRGEKGEAAR